MTKDEALKLALEFIENSECGTADLEARIKKALAQPEPMRLRRGDILRSIETDELCTVWSTSTTGKTLIKWGANDFCGYTAEQIGELFWLEPSPDDLELSAEKSDNYTTPPQRTWVGLTDKEMTHANHHMVEGAYQYSFKQGALWAEAKLKQKNGYAEEENT